MAQVYGDSIGFSVQMEGPFGNTGSSVKIVNIFIPAAAWKGGESPFSQIVEVENISANSKVDLNPSMEQLCTFRDRGTALMAENDGGVVTIHAFGDKPAEDLMIQATLTEVTA